MKDLSLCTLFDRYAPILKQKPREAFHLYYNEDYSLSEIAEITGTSRQAVRDLITRTAEELKSMEAALKLLQKEEALVSSCEKIKRAHPDLNAELDALIALIKE